MKKLLKQQLLCCVFIYLAIYPTEPLKAQTDIDALMMGKNSFCSGFIYNTSSWTNYWEGTNKRNNENLGKVSTQSVNFVANFGITKKLHQEH